MSATKSLRAIIAGEFYLSRMTEHDLLEVVEIEETTGLSCWGWSAYHDEVVERQNALMLVARARKMKHLAPEYRVAGFIAARLTAGEVHINNIGVREMYRRRGIGRALLTCVLEASAGHARAAFLEVRASNRPAQALYQRYGFKIVGRRRHYYNDPVEDALVMSAVLSNRGRL